MKKVGLLLGLPLLTLFFVSGEALAFTDVYDQHAHNEAIYDLETDQVVEGYADGTFKPENRINRAEFTKILVETSYSEEEIESCIGGLPPNFSYAYFPDVPMDAWFAKYVCVAKQKGVIDGYPDGTFKPGNFINFAEASKIIAEAQDVAGSAAGTDGEWFAAYVKGLENKKAIPSSVHFFDKQITRAEMSETVWRLKEGRQDKISATYEELSDPFPAVQSCPALLEKFQEYQSYQYPYYAVDQVMVQESVSASAPTAVGRGGGGAADFSQTNVQVEGVDEADIVKNDGKYIYSIRDRAVHIVEAYPPSIMNEKTVLDYATDEVVPRELYVDGDTLVVIASAYYYYGGGIEPMMVDAMIYPPYYRGSQTKVYVYDISDRSNPVLEREVSYDGDYSDSRRINNQLYLVMNARPQVWAMDTITEGEALLPQMRDGQGTTEPMVPCGDIRYFPGYSQPQYLMLSSMPLDDPNGAIEREVFLGSSENVYSSRTHLYVANSRVNYDRYTDWDWNRDRTRTNVYKFALQDGAMDFIARGEVPGRILNQFSMDAHIRNFRIATTIGNLWNTENPSTNNVYVLDEQMKTVGSLEGIAPGERIYSTRFMGDRLYMVTFKKVDPLFVISLADPTKPMVLGKLKIPGYSDYLHPYDENHIIGFGKDTIEADKGDFAWYQGIKIAMFDVTDVNNPVQQFVEIIGDRGTDSELLHNHKALLFDKERDMMAFPIHIMKHNEALGYSETTFVGALVYDIDLVNGFSERGRITHYTDEDILKMGDRWPYDYYKNIQRVVRIGEFLYSVAPGSIKASSIAEVLPLKFLELSL
ncbi:MAG: beta-propeller domain-containing protein [Candidatus Peregrinibacteria bacterium]|nr:beta-propeller domain-containing protein [Candidatus Peregrinibacteria bacterium]